MKIIPKSNFEFETILKPIELKKSLEDNVMPT
ncbi:hypothetical protein CLV82_2976, partial [Zeaxanthinibacter enoshimensis]